MKIKIGGKPAIIKLPIGGSDSVGNIYEVNNKYLIKNGKPILPIMGEFHYSRYAPNEWEDEILKMQAGGVQILATYVFWIHHEEKKGEWNFSGSRDINTFLEVCKKVNMPVWLRIGPWAHGECRNGGFPDWLVEELGDCGFGTAARNDNEPYLSYVRSFWSRLANETKGHMCKDGGAVIGIQLENEYCHVGGPADRSEGIKHIRTLKALAVELGFDVPYYTTTGWGGAIVVDRETLPVFGGYVDAPWEGHINEMPACENFLITPPDEAAKMDNPYMTAELGGGLQATAHRRTYPFARDIEAQSLCMLAAGANLLGYYMYHGGFNPDGTGENKYATYQESKATKYFNDLPIKGYDFEAPIHESGRLNESFHRLKKLHLLTAAFGDRLAPACAYFPEEQPENAEDMKTPRISARYNHDTKEGFLFVNNHQRRRNMEIIRGLEAELEFADGDRLTLKNIKCASGECAIIPFNLQMGGSRLVSTNASLLAKIGTRYFFYYDIFHFAEKPYFEYEGAPYENVVVLTKEEAGNSYIFDDALYITPRPLIKKDDRMYLFTGGGQEQIRVYKEQGDADTISVCPANKMTHMSVKMCECYDSEKQSVLEIADRYNDYAADAYAQCRVYDITLLIEKSPAKTDSLNLNHNPDSKAKANDNDNGRLNEIYLHIDFAGDKAQLFDGDRLIDDWFSNGDDWYVALKRYDYPTNLKLVVYPFEEQVYYDLPPKKGCELIEASAEAEYKIEIQVCAHAHTCEPFVVLH